MVFASVGFLFYFLPLFLLCFALFPWKNAVIVAFSLVFYAWGEAEYTYVMLGSIGLNYAFGLAIDARAGRARRVALAAGVTANLLVLGWFKYANFLVETLGALGWTDVPPPGIHLPLGISFFTFHAISYLVDVHRREAPVDRSLARVAVYIMLFPQLIAGPIVRYRLIADELRRRSVDLDGFSRGLQLFILGLAQKMLIANTVAVPADAIFALPAEQLTAGLAWLATGCYTLQIYFDFAGYSTMAIGLALMLGFHFPENFRYPYVSQSVTEFWRRWHMTLSNWFRDYLYIPLGGNRRGPVRTYLNLLLVFLLCGLWHGAELTFVAWGLWHGALLVAERAGLGIVLERLPRAVRHAYALLAIMLGWVLFRADSFAQAQTFYAAMFGRGLGDGMAQRVGIYLTPELSLTLAIGLLAATPLPARLAGIAARLAQAPGLAPAARRLAFDAAHLLLLGGGLVLSAMSLAAGTYNPFIYFRF